MQDSSCYLPSCESPSEVQCLTIIDLWSRGSKAYAGRSTCCRQAFYQRCPMVQDDVTGPQVQVGICTVGRPCSHTQNHHGSGLPNHRSGVGTKTWAFLSTLHVLLLLQGHTLRMTGLHYCFFLNVLDFRFAIIKILIN